MTDGELVAYLVHLRDALEAAIAEAHASGASDVSLKDLRALADEIDEKIGELMRD